MACSMFSLRATVRSITARESFPRCIPRRQDAVRHQWAALPQLVAELAAVAPICFTEECQAEADRAILLTLTVPMCLAVAAAAYIARPPPQELKDSGQVFEDDKTGFVFEAAEQNTEPERDKDGLLAFRPISYTPWPVTTDYEGDRIRIPVGPIKDRKPRHGLVVHQIPPEPSLLKKSVNAWRAKRLLPYPSTLWTYVFNKLLPQPSELLTVTLPRPLGVVFEYDARFKRAVVVDVVENSAAAQRRKVAGLNPRLAKEVVQPGDVLRGVTCTNFVYPTKALFGAVPPERHVVVYGADKQSWANVRSALRKGERKDGNVVLVLERRAAPVAQPVSAGNSVSNSKS